MIAVVVDASALVEYLLRTELAVVVEETLQEGAEIHTPALCDVEVISGLRRALRLGRLTERRAAMALEAYHDLPLTRHGHGSLLARALALRENFSAYDAVYVTLAGILGASLLTVDRRLVRAARNHTDLEVRTAR